MTCAEAIDWTLLLITEVQPVAQWVDWRSTVARHVARRYTACRQAPLPLRLKALSCLTERRAGTTAKTHRKDVLAHRMEGHLELTRLRGHPVVGAERSVRDAEEPSTVPAGVSAAHR